MGGAIRILAAGAALAAGRGGGADGAPVRGFGRRVRGCRGGDGGPWVARRHRPLWSAAGAGLPPSVASRLPARGLGGWPRTGHADGSGSGGSRAARAGGDRRRRGGARPAGVDRLAMAHAACLSAAGDGPAAELRRRMRGSGRLPGGMGPAKQ